MEIYNEIVRDLLVDAPPPWSAHQSNNSNNGGGGAGGRDGERDGGSGSGVHGSGGGGGSGAMTMGGHHVGGQHHQVFSPQRLGGIGAAAAAEPLRLLDDPERGTVIERLTDAPVESREALEHLLREVEARWGCTS